MQENFNNRLVIEEVVQRLSDKATATPFPHLKVIGPNPNVGANVHRIFTPFTQDPPHTIGAKVEIARVSSDDVTSRSSVSFFIRRSTSNKRPDASVNPLSCPVVACYCTERPVNIRKRV
jgi:hypothetical protein